MSYSNSGNLFADKCFETALDKVKTVIKKLNTINEVPEAQMFVRPRLKVFD